MGQKSGPRGDFVSKLTYFLLVAVFSSMAMAQVPVVDNRAGMVEKRLTPPGAGTVAVDESKPVVPTAVASNQTPGQKIYNTNCVVCHAAGVAGAPKLGDKAAWAPRLAKGMDTLLSHVIKGFNAMPPKGTCAACSDDELKAAIEYMVK